MKWSSLNSNRVHNVIKQLLVDADHRINSRWHRNETMWNWHVTQLYKRSITTRIHKHESQVKQQQRQQQQRQQRQQIIQLYQEQNQKNLLY